MKAFPTYQRIDSLTLTSYCTFTGTGIDRKVFSFALDRKELERVTLPVETFEKTE